MSRSGSEATDWRVVPLGGEAQTVYSSPDAEKVNLMCPSLLAFPSGRLVAAFDQEGPGVKKLHGPKGRDASSKHWLQGKIVSSTDHGATWSVCESFPFSHPCLFRDGAALYLVGHRGDLHIMKSSDGGATWGRAAALSSQADNGVYTHSPASVLANGDYLYMAVLKLAESGYRGDPVSVLGAEVWRALRGADLTDKRSWTRSETSAPFRELFLPAQVSGAGLPFYDVPDQGADRDVGGRRWATRMGWQEPHLVHISNPDHVWHDPGGHVLHMLASVRANRGNMAVLCRITDKPGEAMRIELEHAPSGTPFWLVSVPGGHQKFSLQYDETSQLYWLAGNVSADSMRRIDRLPGGRSRLPADDNRALQLSFSRNLVDWQFAGLIVAHEDGVESCFDCSMDIRGSDLHVIARCASPDRRIAEDTDEIRMYTIPLFRDLAY